ncbi:MAG: NAD(P)-dependent oxidoreductase [Caulobacteraceae bacterium]
MSLATLGFVGVGRMGGPMTERLLKAGYGVVVYDKSAAAVAALEALGAVAAPTAQAVAHQAEIVLSSLPTPDILQAVMLGPDGISSGAKVKTVVDLSTSGPRMAATVAAGLAERKIDWVDSPVSGGVVGARNGTLAVMVSCKAEVLPSVEPILSNIGKVFYVGDKPGQAQVAKIGNNILAASAMVMTSEVMAMGMKAGLDPQTFLDIIQAGSGRNSAAGDKFPRCVLPGTFDFGFTIGLSYKDVKLCVDEAEGMGVPMVAGAAVRQMLAITTAKYGADADFTNIAKVLEEWAGVEIRAPKGEST